MTKTAQGVEVPAATDEFDPQRDFSDLAASLAGRLVVPVANTTERAAVLAAQDPTVQPVIVYRMDRGTIEVYSGATGPWRTMGAGSVGAAQYVTLAADNMTSTVAGITGSAITVGQGTWLLSASAYADWSTTGNPRINFGIYQGTSTALSTVSVYTGAATGSVPMSAVALFTVASGTQQFTLRGNATGFTGGTVVCQQGRFAVVPVTGA